MSFWRERAGLLAASGQVVAARSAWEQAARIGQGMESVDAWVMAAGGGEERLVAPLKRRWPLERSTGWGSRPR